MATSAHAHTLRTASGLTFTLSLDDHRLALVGLVDFEGRWDILEAAAGQVVDGAAKAERVRQHLLPIAEHLTLLADDLDGAASLDSPALVRQPILPGDREST